MFKIINLVLILVTLVACDPVPLTGPDSQAEIYGTWMHTEGNVRDQYTFLRSNPDVFLRRKVTTIETITGREPREEIWKGDLEVHDDYIIQTTLFYQQPYRGAQDMFLKEKIPYDIYTAGKMKLKNKIFLKI